MKGPAPRTSITTPPMTPPGPQLEPEAKQTTGKGQSALDERIMIKIQAAAPMPNAAMTIIPISKQSTAQRIATSYEQHNDGAR